MAQIAILELSPVTMFVQVDPRFCTFSTAAPMGTRLPAGPGSLIVNANFFFQGSPLGVMVNQGQVIPFTPIPGKSRSALVIADGQAEITPPLSSEEVTAALEIGEWQDATVIQAGPRLIQQGEEVTGNAEDFQPDVFRTTRHVGVGISEAGKLQFLYVENRSLRELTRMLASRGAVEAVNVDGGHAACLRVGQVRRGAAIPFTALVATPGTR